MKDIVIKVLVAGILIWVGIWVGLHMNTSNPKPTDTSVQPPEKPRLYPPARIATNDLPSPPLPTGNKKASSLTAEEKSSVEKRFNERMQPAIEKWQAAYAGHLPSGVADITFDKLHSIDSGPIGGFFTFMLGDTTFTVCDMRGKVKVFYLMTRQAAKDLNSVPTDGKPMNLTVPITREEVLRMAKEDTGLEYELKDVVIQPTAAFCKIDGGASVEVGIKHVNGMELISPDNLSFTMDSNGVIISYQH